MIDRDEVLHVAALARLSLSDEEIEAMRHELSGVLEHVEKIGELDLADVPPTAHVAADEGPPTQALREDEPRECLPLETALAPAPARSDDGFLVPSPQA